MLALACGLSNALVTGPSNAAAAASVVARPPAAALSRRAFGANAGAAVAALALGSPAAFAEEPSRMGGILEPFIDARKGYKLLKPSGWNKFDTDPGVFDVKFQDLIEPFETVLVSTSPVTTAESVTALGELDEVGKKFAKSRDAELIDAKSRSVGGALTYTFELKGPVYHEFLLLTINQGKLYRLACTSTNKRWGKRQELYKNIALSFVPQGY